MTKTIESIREIKEDAVRGFIPRKDREITVTFKGEEFEELERVRNEVIGKPSWHDFFLKAKTYYEPEADGT